ncbi:MAG: hypothetical protein Q4B16_07425 [Bacteroidia bacterium]|nr:hypothetical protein [Bacteroidia bacterium]
MKDEKHIIPELIRSGKSANVTVDDDSFIESLIKAPDEPGKGFWNNITTPPFIKGLRLVMIIASLIIAATFLLCYSFVYLKDVVLFRNEITTNNVGALNPKKSIGREYGIFLFNPADLWADSGIRLNKKDRFRISVSGAFHSSFKDLVDDADSNVPKPEIRWIGQQARTRSSSPAPQDNKKAWGIYQRHIYPVLPKDLRKRNGKNPYFGALLYTVVPEYTLDNPLDPNFTRHVRIWKKKDAASFSKVESPGVLRLAVNDMYFEDKCELYRYAKIMYHQRFVEKDFFPCRITGKDPEHFHTMFYDDNVGQLLVCVEVQHPLKWGWLNPISAYRDFENTVYDGKFLPTLCGAVWFIIHIAIIMAACMLTVFIIIYFLFMLAYLVETAAKAGTRCC